MQNVQRAAAQAVQSVLSGRNLTASLEAALRGTALSRSDRAAVQSLSYGTLRHLGFLRFVLADLAPRAPKDDKVSAILWVAIYQLEFSAAAHYAVVDHAVESVGAIGGRAMKPFANAVLRGYLRRRAQLQSLAARDDQARLSYPQWWIDKLRTQLGAEADRVLEIGKLHPPMTLRVNVRRTGLTDYLNLLRDAGIASKQVGPYAIRLERPLPVEDIPGFREGLVSVQDAGAQNSAAWLDLAPDFRVLDACAAPGGKTAHILELADVALTALDRDPQRLKRVEENLCRLGLSAKTLCADATDLDAWWDGRPFERVLLDAPCSASGVVRRHPDIKWLRRPGDIARFAVQQADLLNAMWKVMARGGKLLYVTCSIFSEENQNQIGRFMACHADARHLGSPAGGDALLLPTEDHDGFFHALLEKV